jgi:hypothetical protein
MRKSLSPHPGIFCFLRETSVNLRVSVVKLFSAVLTNGKLFPGMMRLTTI